ncbi:GNAT family N-acetyltransferase [Nocardia jejuensis]|uniref:GNAT family N-acetyltransferase n=1 Tax=Nocardia jejuensis TaxID=328049 RepID=UPI00083172C7|nr:GNAT family N-acetyltransferase [Nocardia jejuensis]
MDVTVRPALASDIPGLARVLGRAFADDPIMAWSIPDDAVRAQRAGILFGALIRHHFFESGGVEVAQDDRGAIVGGAVWAPPGEWHTSNSQTIRMLPAMARALRGRVVTVGRMADRMELHHPSEPHWYLAIIGTDPSTRGLGHGRALLDSRLNRCDAEGIPAYLESSKPENVPYYERFGFEVTGELDATDGGPLLWPMWRAPR